MTGARDEYTSSNIDLTVDGRLPTDRFAPDLVTSTSSSAHPATFNVPETTEFAAGESSAPNGATVSGGTPSCTR